MAAEVEFRVNVTVGQLLAVLPDKDLVLVRVQQGVLAGKLRRGDRLLAIDGKRIVNLSQFYKVVRRAEGAVDVDFSRSTASILQGSERPPRHIANLFDEREGCDYASISLEWYEKRRRLGFQLAQIGQTRVVVSGVESDCAEAKVLRVGDGIVVIDGRPISDNNVAVNVMERAIQGHHGVELVRERPVSRDAWEKVDRGLANNLTHLQTERLDQQHFPNKKLPELEIGDLKPVLVRELARLKERQQKPKPIFIRPADDVNVYSQPAAQVDIRRGTPTDKHMLSLPSIPK